MAEPKPLIIAELFSNLTGRTVNFTQVLKPPVTNAKQAYGTYLIKPADSLRIVQLDLPLLGSFGGCLLGLPSDAVKERLTSSLNDENLRDAMHEILNVASTIVSIEHRAVFQTMFLDAVPSAILESLTNPAYRSYFNVTVSGYEGGAFSIFGLI